MTASPKVHNKEILKVVAYFDVFEYPLTVKQIISFFPHLCESTEESQGAFLRGDKTKKPDFHRRKSGFEVCSAGRARTYNPVINSHVLCH